MANVNFGNFQATIPSGNDFLVGFRGTSETRITISSLTGLNVPLINSVNTVLSRVSSYESTFTVTRTSSSAWNEAYSSTNLLSSQTVSSNTTVSQNSANWDSSYSIVNANAASWIQTASIALKNTGDTLVAGALTTHKTLSTQFTSPNEFVTKKYVDGLILEYAAPAGTFVASLYYPKVDLYNRTEVDNLIQQSSGQTLSIISSLSSSWTEAYSATSSSSARWDSTHTTTRSNSAAWSTGAALAQSTATNLLALSTVSIYRETNVVEVTTNLTINAANANLYNNKIIHIQSDTAELTITFVSPLPTHFSTNIVNIGTQDVLILPNDGSFVRAAGYRIYGNQYASIALYKFGNFLYALGTLPPAT